MAETTLAPSPVDLTNCDIEPIHIPGSIQPHGALLALDVSMTQVLRHSANAAALLGLEGEINGAAIGDLLGERLAHDLRNALGTMGDTARPALLFGQVGPNGGRFDIAVHSHRSTVIVEFEAVEAGTVILLNMSIKAAVPFVGGKIEKLCSEQIGRSLKKEEEIVLSRTT